MTRKIKIRIFIDVCLFIFFMFGNFEVWLGLSGFAAKLSRGIAALVYVWAALDAVRCWDKLDKYKKAGKEEA
jgi:hypothetical protein